MAVENIKDKKMTFFKLKILILVVGTGPKLQINRIYTISSYFGFVWYL